MNTVRRIASEILNSGESRIRFKPEAVAHIGDALTREDVRALIADGSVFALPKMGVSRIRGRKKQEQKRKGRRFGSGSRKGTFATRSGKKTAWIAKVRAQRNCLSALVEGNKIKEGSSRKIYSMIKGNAFKGVKVLETYLKDNKLLK